MKRKDMQEIDSKIEDLINAKKVDLITYIETLETKVVDLETRVPAKWRLWTQRIIMTLYALYLIYDSRPEEGVKIFFSM